MNKPTCRSHRLIPSLAAGALLVIPSAPAAPVFEVNYETNGGAWSYGYSYAGYGPIGGGNQTLDDPLVVETGILFGAGIDASSGLRNRTDASGIPALLPAERNYDYLGLVVVNRIDIPLAPQSTSLDSYELCISAVADGLTGASATATPRLRFYAPDGTLDAADGETDLVLTLRFQGALELSTTYQKSTMPLSQGVVEDGVIENFETYLPVLVQAEVQVDTDNANTAFGYDAGNLIAIDEVILNELEGPPAREVPLATVDYDTAQEFYSYNYSFSGYGAPNIDLPADQIVLTNSVSPTGGVDGSAAREHCADSTMLADDVPTDPAPGYTWFGTGTGLGVLLTEPLPSGSLDDYRVRFQARSEGYAEPPGGRLRLTFFAPDDTLAPADADTDNDLILELFFPSGSFVYGASFSEIRLDLDERLIAAGSLQDFVDHYADVSVLQYLFESDSNLASAGYDAGNCLSFDNIELVQLLPGVPPGPVITDITADAPDQFSLTFTSDRGFEYEIRRWVDAQTGFAPVATVCATSASTTYTRTAPLSGTELFQVARLGPVPEMTLYSEDFEGGQSGWSAVDLDGAASSTLWEFGPPAYTDLVIIDSANSGTNAWGTDLDDEYMADTGIALRSPPLDFTGACVASVQWAQVLDLDFGDEGTVNLRRSSDDSLVAEIATILDDDLGDTSWQPATFPLPDDVLGTSGEFYLEFVFESDGLLSLFAGWYIDDVRIVQP